MKHQPKKFSISTKVKNKLRDKKTLQRELAEGKSAQEVIGFSDESMTELYKAACQLMDHRRFVDAANAFLFLATLNAYEHEYWLGLGMCTQLYGDFEGAIDAYELAAICDVENPIPYFYLAKCLFATHERENAREALQITIDYAGNHPHYQELKKQAMEALILLEDQNGD
jgi:type III secretion system low calcium response chaperone LcrH/SycD